MHALLNHLHATGFRAAPRPLGIDDRGREVLTFAPGETVWPDRFALLEPPRKPARVARLIRDFHDAAEGFTPPADAQWQSPVPRTASSRCPRAPPGSAPTRPAA
ncbi:hypothetical protein [Streptomyces sp. URMC 124]|uniref:hypothetical protein n=1 Tax=Streptomyces sp. URMC 124 TaxID=3423405 RepID=UPI003F193E69